MTWIPISSAAVSRKEVSRSAFGYPVVGNLNDLNSRLTDAEKNKVVQTRKVVAGAGLTGGGDLSADRTISANIGSTAGTVMAGDDPRVGVLQKYGRWYYPDSHHIDPGTSPFLTDWGEITRMDGVVEDEGSWTFENAGVYEMTFGWHVSYGLLEGVGFNSNAFISSPDIKKCYGQQQGYNVMYSTEHGDLESSGTIHSGPVALAKGDVIRVGLGYAQQVEITGADGLRRNFFAIRQVA